MQIKNLVTKLVLEANRYLQAKEIASLSGLSLFSLYRNIPEGLEEFQNKLGFLKPNKFENYGEEVAQKIKELVLKEGRPLPEIYMADVLKISRSTFLNFGIDTNAIQSELGFHPVVYSTRKPRNGKRPRASEAKPSAKRTTEEIRDEAISVIEKYGMYCPSRVISQELGIPQSTLSFRGINTEMLNQGLGYTRDNRFFEFAVLHALEEVFPGVDILRQKWFPDCKSVLGNVLFFDFYLPSLNLAVEADGPCHYDENHPWFTEKVVSRDGIKVKYCEENEITLIRIKYENVVTKETILKHLSGTPLEPGKLQRNEKS